MVPIKNKGMYLETILNITNNKYISEGTCVVTKIPTNIKLINANNQLITKASFDSSFNCDYIGVYKGRYFEFEAKETSKKYFDFALLRNNQKEKLKVVHENKGLSFLIIYFSEFETYFMVQFNKISEWVSANKNKIPYEWFDHHGIEIFLMNDLKLDYIRYFDLYFE